ncbi:MAG: hypothetical protein MHM6MM_000301 [Cercozoa sp. M6MM]
MECIVRELRERYPGTSPDFPEAGEVFSAVPQHCTSGTVGSQTLETSVEKLVRFDECRPEEHRVIADFDAVDFAAVASASADARAALFLALQDAKFAQTYFLRHGLAEVRHVVELLVTLSDASSTQEAELDVVVSAVRALRVLLFLVLGEAPVTSRKQRATPRVVRRLAQELNDSEPLPCVTVTGPGTRITVLRNLDAGNRRVEALAKALEVLHDSEPLEESLLQAEAVYPAIPEHKRKQTQCVFEVLASSLPAFAAAMVSAQVTVLQWSSLDKQSATQVLRLLSHLSALWVHLLAHLRHNAYLQLYFARGLLQRAMLPLALLRLLRLLSPSHMAVTEAREAFAHAVALLEAVCSRQPIELRELAALDAHELLLPYALHSAPASAPASAPVGGQASGPGMPTWRLMVLRLCKQLAPWLPDQFLNSADAAELLALIDENVDMDLHDDWLDSRACELEDLLFLREQRLASDRQWRAAVRCVLAQTCDNDTDLLSDDRIFGPFHHCEMDARQANESRWRPVDPQQRECFLRALAEIQSDQAELQGDQVELQSDQSEPRSDAEAEAEPHDSDSSGKVDSHPTDASEIADQLANDPTPAEEAQQS